MQPPPFHRAYRHVELPATTVGWNVFVALLPAVALLWFAQPVVTGHARLVIALLQWTGVPIALRPASLGRVMFEVPDLIAPVAPDVLYAATLAIVGAVIALVALLTPRRFTPGRVITGVVALVCSSSGFFFWLGRGPFPYSGADFAATWTRAEFVVWVLIPVVYACTLGPLPLSARTTLFFTVETVAYAMWFSAVRLTLLEILFHVAGFIWMAPAYFALGFLIDFFFIVAYYSLAVSRAARELRRNRQVWRW